ERDEEIELGDRRDLEAGAFLDQRLQDARVRIRLHREVRTDAGKRGAEAASLRADDVEIDDEKRLLVAVPREVLLDSGEVEADFRVGIEREIRGGPESLYRGGSGHRGRG